MNDDDGPRQDEWECYEWWVETKDALLVELGATIIEWVDSIEFDRGYSDE